MTRALQSRLERLEREAAAPVGPVAVFLAAMRDDGAQDDEGVAYAFLLGRSGMLERAEGEPASAFIERVERATWKE